MWKTVVIVVNAGSNVQDQYSCLTNGNNDPLFNFATIDEDTLTPGVDDIEDEICQTPFPTPRVRPTPCPTSNYSPNPTSRPTSTPTNEPSPHPINNSFNTTTDWGTNRQSNTNTNWRTITNVNPKSCTTSNWWAGE